MRRALDTLLAKAGSQLDDEAFRTFMTEAECIVNSRPLTTNNLSDAEALEPHVPTPSYNNEAESNLTTTWKLPGRRQVL